MISELVINEYKAGERWVQGMSGGWGTQRWGKEGVVCAIIGRDCSLYVEMAVLEIETEINYVRKVEESSAAGGG